jgi:membrane-anchored glycerophosphoryl diester phosphodiesterase (GDPDase)
MILGGLTESAKTIAFKPYVLIPMLIVVIVQYLMTEATTGLISGYVSDLILYGEALSQIDPVLFILGNYPLEIILLIISGIIMLFVTIIAFVSISKISNDTGFISAINSSVMEWKRNLGLVIFGLLVTVLFFAIFFGILYVLDFIDTITGGVFGALIYFIIVVALIVVLATIFTVKLAFTLPAFAQGEKVRDAIQRSWEMTNDSFWNALIFVLILVIITVAIYLLFLFLSINILELEIILLSLGEIISMTFFILGISHYYYKR